MERGDFRFSRRDVRAFTGWGDTQLKVHLHRLEELEYLLAHRGGRGQSFVYELLCDVKDGGSKPVLAGLIDVAKLMYDGKKSGFSAEKSGSVGPKSGVSGSGRSAAIASVYGPRSCIMRLRKRNSTVPAAEANNGSYACAAEAISRPGWGAELSPATRVQARRTTISYFLDWCRRARTGYAAWRSRGRCWSGISARSITTAKRTASR